MKKIMLLGALFAAGCATTPVPSNSSAPSPVRVLTPELFTATEGAGTIVVTRDSGWIGSKCRMRLYLDAKPVADMQPGERAVIYTTPGNHILATGPSPESNVLCRSGAESMRRETAVEIASGQTLRYRQALSANGEPALMPTAF